MDIIQNGFEILRASCQNRANVSIMMRRNERDEFQIEIEESGVAKLGLTPARAVDLIPSGSTWSPAEGWRGFIGRTVDLPSGRAFLLGMDAVNSHPTRGATPEFAGFLFPTAAPPLDVLASLHGRLGARSPLNVPPYGYIEAAENCSSEDQRAIEAGILAQVMHSYNTSEQVQIFNTAVIAQSRFDEIPIQIPLLNVRRCLVALVPRVLTTFRGITHAKRLLGSAVFRRR